MPKEILYSVVARGATILCEQFTTGSKASGANYPTVTQKLLQKYPTNNGAKKTFHIDENYDFHTYTNKDITFVALSDRDHQMRVVYAYLENISTDFFGQYDSQTITSAGTFGLTDFAKTLKKEITKFNDPSNDSITAVQDKLDKTKSTMVQNIDQMMSNHEKAGDLMDRSQNLLETSTAFNKQSNQLRCEMLKQKWKLIAVIGIIFIIILIIIIWQAS